MRKIFLVFCIFFFNDLLQAQSDDPLHFLPGATVYDVARDDNGFLWFGTSSGLMRFDGYEYTTFTVLDGLPSNEIFEMAFSADGSLWMRNFTGRPAYLRDGILYNEQTDERLRGMASGTTHTAIFLHKNTTYIASENSYLAIISDSESQNIIIPRSLIRNIYVDEEGQIWLNNQGEVGLYYPEENRFDKVLEDTFVAAKPMYIDGEVYWATRNGYKNITGTAEIPEFRFWDDDFPARIVTAALTSDGKFAIGTNQGLYFYDTVTRQTVRKELEGMYVTAVFYDIEGNVWASTLSDGVYLFTAGQWNNRFINSRDWSTNMFTRLAVTEKEEIILGTGTNTILHISETDIKSHEVSLNNPPRNELGVVEYAYGNLILGGTAHLYWSRLYEDQMKPTFWKSPLSVIKGIHIVSQDSVYASSIEGVDLFVRNPETGEAERKRILSEIRTSAVVKHPEWGVIYGTPSGLFIIKESGPELLFDELETEQITSLKLLRDGSIAVGTNGLGAWIIKNGRLRWLVEEGFNVLSIREINEDADGALWFSTTEGLFEYSDGRFTQFASGNVKTSGFLDGKIVYGGSNSVIITNREKTGLDGVRLNLQKPKITVDGEFLDEYSVKKLHHSTRSVQIDTRAAYFRTPGSTRYFYTFNLQDEKWDASLSPQLTFRDMRPGNYNLFIKASAENGEIESEITQVNFIIEPPFWQKRSFILIFIAFLSVSAFMLVRLRIQTVQKKEQEKLAQYKRTVELEQQALSAMMNPHFVFNVLNSIRYYVAEKTPGEAQEYLAAFAKLIRLQLEGSFQKNTSLSAELERLEMYVRLESLRLKHPLNFTIDTNSLTEDDLFDIEIPAMLLQPFVENSIWHGIQPKNAPGSIQVSVGLEGDDWLKIEITDDGVGIGHSKKETKDKEHASLAMHLIKERLKLIGAEKGKSVEIQAQPGEAGGTKVVLSVPI